MLDEQNKRELFKKWMVFIWKEKFTQTFIANYLQH